MKRISCFFIITFFISCNTNKQEKIAPEKDSVKVNIKTDTVNIISDTHYFWSSDWDTKKGLVMRKITPISEDSLTPSNLIHKLNIEYPEIQLGYKKISGDTIFVAIHKSRYLTQSIGSSGAKGYLAEVTYNLTEIKNINFVDINFAEGDHAAPGTFSRTDFVR
jgi:hypothetical protein